MSTTGTLAYSGRLVATTCWCGIHHGIPETLYDKAEREPGKQNVYCPLGHSWVFTGDSEAAKLKRQLKFAEDQNFALRAERDQLEARRRAQKAQVTKLRKRLVAGVCPFGCRRHFTDLERHVASKHPGAELAAEHD